MMILYVVCLIVVVIVVGYVVYFQRIPPRPPFYFERYDNGPERGTTQIPSGPARFSQR